MTVCTGFWRGGMTHYLDRHPHLKHAHEHDSFQYAMDNKSAFDGMWVNSVMILNAFDPCEVVVVREDLSEVRMSDDASLMKKYQVLDTGEVYIDTAWHTTPHPGFGSARP